MHAAETMDAGKDVAKLTTLASAMEGANVDKEEEDTRASGMGKGQMPTLRGEKQHLFQIF